MIGLELVTTLGVVVTTLICIMAIIAYQDYKEQNK